MPAVKYDWRTLQLLPSAWRPSYAGARVEVLERPGGELAVRHRGRPSPPGSPRPAQACCASAAPSWRATRRSSASLWASAPGWPRPTSRSFLPRRTGPQARVKPLRPPTPRQQTLWKAIRQAQLQGLSMRATARVLGISRNTVRRYVLAGGPPGRQGAASSTEQRPAREDIFAEPLSGQSR